MEVHNVTADAETFTCNAYLTVGDRTVLVDAGAMDGVVDVVREHTDHLEALVADDDVVAVGDGVGASRVVAVGVTVRIVERLADGVELGDVIAVLVREHDSVEMVGVLADDIDDAGHRPRVDEYRPVAHGEVRVAGERLRVGSDVVDFHTPP